jgi:polyisoprenoid-binding protein YceI
MSVLLLLTACERIDPPMNVQVELESRLRIDGSTTVSSFACQSEEVYGGALITEGAFRGDSSVVLGGAGRADLRVPVHSLDCGRRAMNEDLFEALKVDAHPTIQFDLERVDVLERAGGGDGPYRLGIMGALTIAGVERSIEVEAVGEAVGAGRGRAYGRKSLLMSDFGVDPPVAMLGLIRVQDEIEVHFDLVGSTTRR